MPIIPLLTRSNPLPNAPAPVLDRERRPTVDNSGVAHAVGQFAAATKQPMLDANALTAPYEALGTVGRAVAQAGSVLGALAIKRKEAQSDKQVSDADGVLAEAQAGFEVWKVDHPDPAEWDAEGERRIGAAKKSIFDNPKLNTGAREQLGPRVARFEGQFRAAVALSATKETFAQAKSAFLATTERATEEQNPETFETTLRTGLEKGYFYPHEAENARQRFQAVGERKRKEAAAGQERQEYEQAAAAVIRDPIGWRAANKEPWKGKEILWAKMMSLDEEQQRIRTGSLVEEVHNAIAKGSLRTPAEIDAIASPLMNQPLKSALKEDLLQWNEKLTRQKKAEPADGTPDGVPNGIVQGVKARQLIRDYDPNQDPDGVQGSRLAWMVRTKVDDEMAKDLMALLRAKVGLEGGEPRPEVQRNIAQTLDVIFNPTEGAFKYQERASVTRKPRVGDLSSLGAKQGDAVRDGEENPEPGRDGHRLRMPEPEWKIDLREQQSAINARARIEMEMQDWLRANPEKARDIDAVQRQLREVIPKETQKAFLRKLPKLGAQEVQGAPRESGRPARAAVDESLLAMVKDLEGFSPRAFGDFKQNSVGYGTQAKSLDEVLDEPAAAARLRDELAQHAGRIDAAAQQAGMRLTKGQRQALISFDFNTGQGAELLTSSGGKPAEIKRRMALYTKAGGHELPGLVARRKKELALFES